MGNDSQQMVPANGGASIARQGFGETSLERIRETSQAAMVAQARAQVEAMFVVARSNPRSWDNVRVQILAECRRPAFAKAAWFKKPQGGSFVEGLSVRFAETALRLAGNLRRGTRTNYEDDQKRQINVFVVDCETNAETSRDITLDKIVERKNPKGRLVLAQRTNSAGESVFIVSATDDELLMKEGALVSKVGRVLILQMIPGDILDECREQIQKTRANDDAKDPGAARKAVADAFAALGVMPADLARYLGHEIAQCTPIELEDLRGIYAAVRDGEVSWSEVLSEKTGTTTQATDAGATVGDADKPQARGSRLASRVRKEAGAPAAATPTTPAAPATTSPTLPGEPATASQPQGAPKGGAATQVSMLGGTATIVDGVVQSITPDPPRQEPVIPPATHRQDDEAARKERLAEQARLCSAWPGKVGIPVTVSLAGGQTHESFTTSMARMFGEMAVVNVEGFASPLAITQLTRND
jgi:hypothetical protein